MTPSFLIKLSGLLLVSWVTLGAGPLSTQPFGILCGLILLMACLDAGQASQGASTSKDGAVEMGVFFGRLVSLGGAPFYVALMVFAFVGMSGKGAGGAARPAMASASLCGAEGGGCGSSGGCGTGGCGASSGGACGCSSGKKSSKSTASSSPKAPMKKLTDAELKQRTDMVQQRAMSAGAAGAASLPGIGPNGRPLPAGLVPKPGAALPPGVVPTGVPAASAERGLSSPQQVATPSHAAVPKEATSAAPPAADLETRAPVGVPTGAQVPSTERGLSSPQQVATPSDAGVKIEAASTAPPVAGLGTGDPTPAPSPPPATSEGTRAPTSAGTRAPASAGTRAAQP